MPIILYVLFAISFLPFVMAWTAIYFRINQFGTFDNHHPRQQQAALTGTGGAGAGGPGQCLGGIAAFYHGVLYRLRLRAGSEPAGWGGVAVSGDPGAASCFVYCQSGLAAFRRVCGGNGVLSVYRVSGGEPVKIPAPGGGRRQRA